MPRHIIKQVDLDKIIQKYKPVSNDCHITDFGCLPSTSKSPAAPTPTGLAARASVFGNAYHNSVDADWTEYKGVGWVYKDEAITFAATYAQCKADSLWYVKSKMVKMADGSPGFVFPKNLDKGAYLRCEVSGYAMLPADAVYALNGDDEKRAASRSFMEGRNGIGDYIIKCDYSGKDYFSGNIIRITDSEKYKCVATRFINGENFGKCGWKCGNFFEVKDIPPRDDMRGSRMCKRCYVKAQKAGVILKHNADNYPDRIHSVKTRMGHRRNEEGVVATNKREEVVDARLFGVESEVEMYVKGCQKDEMDRFAMAMAVKQALGTDFAIIKEDGTLTMNGKYSDDNGTGPLYAGFEIVTAPADLAIQRERWPRIVKADGYKHLRAWDTDTCGFHVHVSRNSLTSLQIGRMLVFINGKRNQRFVQKVSGRKSSEYYKYKERPIGDVLKMEARSDATRRWAINLTNPDTVEFRIFRGTVNPRHILRNIEFVDAMCDYCYPCSRSLSELGTTDGFLAFVSAGRKRWSLLAEWLALHKMIDVKPPSEKADRSKFTLNLDDVPEPEIKSEDAPSPKQLIEVVREANQAAPRAARPAFPAVVRPMVAVVEADPFADEYPADNDDD